MKQVVWLLEDSLGPIDPALRALPEAPAVYIYDEDDLRAHPTSFKRLFFIYESLVETFAGRSAPCEIRRGNLVREMIDFCRKYGAEEIHVTRSPSPAYRLWTEQLRHTLVVVEYAPETLVKWSGRPPRRFLELWEQAYPQLLPEEKPGADEDEES